MNHRTWLITLLLVMATLQFGLAVRHSLWADELFSLAMATGHSLEHAAAVAKPEWGDYVEQELPVTGAELRRYAEFEAKAAGPAEVVRAVFLSDTSPPLYYLLLNVWTRIFGVSDIALRSLSIVFSLACLPLVFGIGRALGGERAATIAAGLFAIAPLSLYYSAEGRMYSLLWFCVLALVWATVRLFQGLGGGRMQTMWVAASAAGFLVHYYFLFTWAAVGLFLLLRPGKDSWGKMGMRIAFVVVLILPWYLRLPENLAQWRITEAWVKWEPADYNRWIALRDILFRYFTGDGQYLWQAPRLAQIGGLFAFGLAAVVTVARFGRHVMAGVALLISLWFVFACVGPWIADIVRGSFIAQYPRYASAAMPAACLLGGWALGNLGRRFAWPAMLLVALCWSPSIATIFQSRSRSGQAIRDVAKHVGGFGSSDLMLVHSIPSGGILLARYLHTPVSFAIWTGQLGQRQIPGSMETLVAGRKVVVLVKLHTVGEPAPEETWLKANAEWVKNKQLGDVFIDEYRPLRGDLF